jgi:hypothetical protein
MNEAFCEPLAFRFVAGDLNEDRRRGGRSFPAAGRGITTRSSSVAFDRRRAMLPS